MSEISKVELHFIQKKSLKNIPSINTSAGIFKLLHGIYDRKKIDHSEFFYAIYVNRKGQPIGEILLSFGGQHQTIVDIRALMQGALLANAAQIIITHNHTTDNVDPSDEDIKVTKKINQACAMFGINLMDHIIYSPEKYFSFTDDGII